MNIPQMLARVEHKIGWVFRNKLTAIEALNSAAQPIRYDERIHTLRRNDELAIVGDRAIDVVLSVMWYRSRDTQDLQLTSDKYHKFKGVMSALQKDLVTNEALAVRGFSHGLDACVITNDGHVGRISDQMMATAVEAIVGAVFKDSDFDIEAVRAAMARLGFFGHQLLARTNCESITGHTGPTPEA
jgi:ribonuclease-3